MIGERQLGYGLGNTRIKLTYLSDFGQTRKNTLSDTKRIVAATYRDQEVHFDDCSSYGVSQFTESCDKS